MIALGLSFIVYHLSFCVACSDDDATGFVPEAEPIRILQNDLLFGAESSSASVVVEADGAISATTDADWCEASVSGRVITVTVSPNSNFDSRTALLTIVCGDASRQLPVQQQGMVLDLPLISDGHYSPTQGDSFEVPLQHSLPVDISTPHEWIHPVLDGSTLRISTDNNSGGHIRRGYVVCKCGEYSDTLRIGQFDMKNDIEGSYYMMGYYGGSDGTPTATRFDIILRNDSLFMHWPQERYAEAYIPLSIDKVSCTIFIPTAFTLYENANTRVNGYFYDADGNVSVNSSIGINVQLSYYDYNTAGVNMGIPVMANWPGHQFGGFIIRQTSFVTTTLIQLSTPIILMRVGPVGATLSD